MSDTDLELLARYARCHAEDAFSEVVRRHLDLVHSAALRQVRSPQLAEEVAQSTFIKLAGHAHRLAPDTILTAWLYQVASRESIDVVRREARRRLREQIATEMNAMNATADDWTHIEPLLDEAMHALDDADRTAVLLRFFENKSLREVGATLGTTDDAARRRVSRAVERLREFFAKRGVTVGAQGLVVVISANAVQAAPVGLVFTISTAALASVSAGSGALTFLNLMIATKVKLVAASVLALAVIVLLLRQDGRNSAEQNNSTPPATENPLPSATGGRPRTIGNRRGQSPQQVADSAAAAKQIVTEKMSRFGRSRRDIVHTMSRQSGKAVPNEIEQFFDAVDAGNWEEINTRWQALAKRSASHGDPKDHWPELDPFWPAVLETWGVAKSVHDMPAQQLLDYGETILGALRPGMVYLGGTDYGRFVPTLLNETTDGQRHIVLTQSQLIDGRYLDYVRFLYGDQISLLTHEDAKRAFAEYLADYQKRLTHDGRFPDEPKQVRPGEEISGVEPGEGVPIDADRINASNYESATAVIERTLKILMEKNPTLSFAMEQSRPLPSISADAAPLGPLLELRVLEQKDFSQDRALQSVDYWRAMSEKLLSDPQAADSLATRLSYAKAATDQADLLLKRGYTTEAEQTLRIANEVGPASPEAFFQLLKLLLSQKRLDEALSVAETAVSKLPPIEELRAVFGEEQRLDSQFRNALDEVKRMQKTK